MLNPRPIRNCSFGIRNLVGVQRVHAGQPAPKHIFLDYSSWPAWARATFDWVFMCHYGHLLDFGVALLCYAWLWPQTFPEARTWQVGWVAKVVAFNLAVEFIIYGFWHYVVYVSPIAHGNLKAHKYNKNNQYEPEGSGRAPRMFGSSTGQLEREVLLTTLGFLQSSAFQCVVMWLWASGRVPYYANFWAHPLYSVGCLLFMTYWRELHFYWVHRAMHPWWNRKLGLSDGDVGAFLYRWVHSLHHKSSNPGPFSGLSMHPVEHLLYYSCTLLPLLLCMHPLHFLYVKFHADIAPLGGHDGYAEPGGGADFHYLHHAHFEVNYGVPLIDFDRLFGTWMDYGVYQACGGDFLAAKRATTAGRNSAAVGAGATDASGDGTSSGRIDAEPSPPRSESTASGGGRRQRKAKAL